VTARPESSAPGGGELRAFLAGRLPEYMLPGAFVVLADLPRTAGGELDLGALPVPQEKADLGGDAMAPGDGADGVGRIVAEIWRELLEVEKVELRDNFFALGGHSLLLLPMQEKVRERFGITLPVVELFKFPTVGALAAHLATRRAAETPRLPGTADRSEGLREGRERLKKRAERTARKAGAR